MEVYWNEWGRPAHFPSTDDDIMCIGNVYRR